MTDFGLASEATANQLNDTTSARGSVGYRAPELAQSSQFSNKVDIWSLGCLFHELATKRRAFHNDYAVLEFCAGNKEFHVCLDNIPDPNAKASISEAISQMLQKEPSARPTAAMLYNQFCVHCPENAHTHCNKERRSFTAASIINEGKWCPILTDE